MIQPVTFDASLFAGMIEQFSKDITRTPVTKVINNLTGDETLVEGTPVTIIGTIFLKKNVYNQGREGLVQQGDATFVAKPSVVVVKNDLLSYSGTTYRVNNVTIRYLDQTPIYVQADLFVVSI